MKKRSILMLVLAMSLTLNVFAAGQTIQALVTDITVKLDGQTLDLRDANGAKVDVVAINGSTYLPIRAISSNVGLGVTWDGNTRTVLLTTDGQPLPQPQPQPQPQSAKTYEAGKYQVGKDIPAGTYYLKTTGEYGGYAKSSSKSDFSDIIDNDAFKNWTFFTIHDGEYFKLDDATAVIASSVGSIAPSDGIYKDGHYRVGIDIPAGTYTFIGTDDIASAVEFTGASGTGDLTQMAEDGEQIVLTSGHYLEIRYGYIKTK